MSSTGAHGVRARTQLLSASALLVIPASLVLAQMAAPPHAGEGRGDVGDGWEREAHGELAVAAAADAERISTPQLEQGAAWRGRASLAAPAVVSEGILREGALLTSSEVRGKLSGVHDAWRDSAERPGVSVEKRRWMDVTLGQLEIVPLRWDVECRESACRYFFAFPTVAEMDALQRFPRQEIEGELVVGHPERRSGEQTIAIYEVFQW